MGKYLLIIIAILAIANITLFIIHRIKKKKVDAFAAHFSDPDDEKKDSK